jgi:glycerophosphoryl diester phosphodiesterase
MGVNKLSTAPFPYLIAHRGLSGLIPENTLPAFGGAIGLGVQEIEFDIRLTLDEKVVVCHDATVDRTSNGHGFIDQMTWEEIAKLDAGSWLDPAWTGLRFCQLKDVFVLFGGLITMNIHVKAADKEGHLFRKVYDLIESHNLFNQVYIAAKPDILRQAYTAIPMIHRCCLETNPPSDIVKTAIELKCDRVQFRRKNVSADQIQLAHENSLICNLFYSDNYQEAEKFTKMGIDAILSNFPNRLLRLIASKK